MVGFQGDHSAGSIDLPVGVTVGFDGARAPWLAKVVGNAQTGTAMREYNIILGVVFVMLWPVPIASRTACKQSKSACVQLGTQH